ncbi:MAG: IS66 family transposase [Thermoplasmata archaeon]
MAARDPRLLLATNEQGPITLTREQRLEILRRLEKLEADNERLRRDTQELRDRLKVRDQEIAEHKKELDRLRQHAAALDVATPPSKKLHRPAAPAEPRVKGRRPGGQPGHVPHGRGRPDRVDETVDLTLEDCPGCGQSLGEPADTYERFVTELIPAYLWVLKILVHRYWCRHCHQFVQGTTDRALPGRQLGPRLASIIVLLSMMGLPVRRIQETLTTMADLEVSGGEVQDLLEMSAEKLGPDYEAIREEVRAAHLVQPDETSMRVKGANWWAWSFPTERAAYYDLDRSRGKDVVERVLGRDFPGTVVSDDWCAYNCLKGKRGVCWIHINRHLQSVEVAHGIEPRGPRSLSDPVYRRAGHPPERFLRFAHDVRTLLREAVDWSEMVPAQALQVRERKARVYEERIRQLCDPDSTDKDVGRISRNLLKRMPYLFEFVRDARIPWHNNAGERAIRPICVKRKMSGGMRSETGARTYARLKSVHETARRKGQDFLRIVMEALTRTLSGKPSTGASTG